MDLDNVPDLLLWTLLFLVLIDIFRRLTIGQTYGQLKRLLNSLIWPVYPDVGSLVVQLGDSKDLSAKDPLPSHFPECASSSTNYRSHLKQFHTLDSLKIARLTGRYPHLTSICLTLNNASYRESEYIVKLLSTYAHSLKYLMLEVNFLTTTQSDILLNSAAIRQLFECINLLPKLSHLSLELANQLPAGSPPIALPVLGQLHTFALFSSFNSLFAESFARHAATVSSIHLSNEQPDNSLSLTTVNPQICSRLVDLSFTPFLPMDNKIDFLCASFHNLQFLKVSLEHLYLARLANSLSQLANLEGLDLEITSSPMEPIKQSNRIPRDRIGQLAALKRLRLSVAIESHTDLHSVHLGWIFPRLETLSLMHNYFTCEVCLVNHFAFQLRLMDICKREMLKPWQEQCPTLQTITVKRW